MSCSSADEPGRREGCVSSVEAPSHPWHCRMQTKHVRCPQPMQSAKESRSDFFVGFLWQMWQGSSFAELDFTMLGRAWCGSI